MASISDNFQRFQQKIAETFGGPEINYYLCHREKLKL